MAHKKETSAFEVKAGELNVMKDALRWNINFQPDSKSVSEQQIISAQLRPHRYHHGVAVHQKDEHLPLSEVRRFQFFYSQVL